MQELLAKYLLDSNPTSYRSDLGPIDALTEDIRENGILVPLLITRDFAIIDGFRRLAVAYKLHLETVPVQFITTWSELVRAFKPTDPGCYPMEWEDLLVFWDQALKPLHKQHQIKASITARRSGVASGRKAASYYSEYQEDLARIYQVQPTTIKTLRDYLNRLHKNEDRFPLFVKGALALLPKGEAAGKLVSSRVIKSVIDKLLTTETWSEQEALAVLEQRLRSAITTDRPRVPRVTNIKLNRDAPVTPKVQLDSMMNVVLDQLATQASGMVNFNLSPREAEQYIETLSDHMTALNALRKRLKAVLAEVPPEEAPAEQPTKLQSARKPVTTQRKKSTK